MPLPTSRHRCTIAVACFLLIALPAAVVAQGAGLLPSVATRDSVTIAANARAKASGLHRFLLGGVYRDLWTAPMRVPVLDLRTFAGGLRVDKEGGGNQTRSLHLTSASGVDFVFRSVRKWPKLPPEWRGGIFDAVARDAVSNSHPAGSLVAARLMAAADILHVTPVLVVMPDDALLGEFRSKYAGMLGAIEEEPASPTAATPGFAGAAEVIGSDSLLALLGRDPTQQVNARSYLVIRLMDMLINDWDRGPSQWKWVRFGGEAGTTWEPLPRDRDKALISVSGFLPKLASAGTKELQAFGPRYGTMPGLTYHSAMMDGRLLGGLEWGSWDSIATALAERITDAVIDDALLLLPPEYQGRTPGLARELRQRRDALPAVAKTFYRYLAGVVDLHGTEVAEQATVTRSGAGMVEVRLQAIGAAPHFVRRFDARETQEIRIYLHGGDDSAVVVGDVPSSIVVRVIGGNGDNHLTDQSRAAGHSGTADLTNQGSVRDVSYYRPDTVWNRRPQYHLGSARIDPVRDHGGRLTPLVALSIGRDYGIMPGIGLTRYRYAFDHSPYSSRVGLEAHYSLKRGRSTVSLRTDQRFTRSPIHLTMLARMSQLELLNFYGYGNATTALSDTAYYGVRQRQWQWEPALAWSPKTNLVLSLGPVIRYSVTDSIVGRFISAIQPYGFGAAGRFGEAGVRLSLRSDSRIPKRRPASGTTFELAGSIFPAVWNVTSAFAAIDLATGAYFRLPVPTKPMVTLHAGGRKLFGDFPLQDAAFIGGSATVRGLEPQRYAGDASLYGIAELRIPVARLTIVVPVSTGLLGTAHYGRVWMAGESPGGWHNIYAGGFYVGFSKLTVDIRVVQATDVGHTQVSLSVAMPTRPSS